MGEMEIMSPAFEDEGLIPGKYTCDGEDVNPPLKIDAVPDGAESLALIMDDPDAPSGTFVHWVVWNIDPGVSEIEADSVPGEQGLNSFKKTDYGGPCPPSGTHRYYFKLYALDTTLDLGSDTTKGKLENAIEGHVIAQTQVMGKYSRG